VLDFYQFFFIFQLLASILVLTAIAKNRTSTRKPTVQPTTSRPLNSVVIPSSTMSQVLQKLVTTPRLKIKVKIYCRNDYFLVVLPSGSVRGGRNDNDSIMYGVFEMQGFASGVFRIKNLPTNRYVGINKKGRVFSTVSTCVYTLLIIPEM